MNKKTFVIGDIHGGYKALKECLEKSKFDYNNDKLIVLGDVADGWSEVPECIEELLKIKNLVYILGNHDIWLRDWFKNQNIRPMLWVTQGGLNTIKAYENNPKYIAKHCNFFNDKSYYYKENNNIFIHGGFNHNEDIDNTPNKELLWNRDLWFNRHKYKKIEKYNEVFLGHTSIWFSSNKPLCHGNVWFMDTGGGYEGKLSMMNIETKEIFQSKKVSTYYNIKPRGL